MYIVADSRGSRRRALNLRRFLLRRAHCKLRNRQSGDDLHSLAVSTRC
jgi:hypothetical protein